MVYPAAGLVEVASWAGAFLVEVNTAGTPLTGMMDCVLREPAGVALPRLVAAALEPGLPQPGGGS
jgi:NAD-dependent SIR2 family protein deacetylase